MSVTQYDSALSEAYAGTIYSKVPRSDRYEMLTIYKNEEIFVVQLVTEWPPYAF